jgi:glucose/arabinose dehydrogenase
MNPKRSVLLAGCLAFAACSGGSGGGMTPESTSAPTAAPVSHAGSCAGTTTSKSSSGMTPTTPPLTVPAGLMIQTIATVPGGARELVALPNGDLIVGTSSTNVYIVPNAESSAAAGTPQVFASVNGSIPPGAAGGNSGTDNNPEGVAFSQSTCTLYVATQYHVWSTPYTDGDLQAEHLQPIATVRTGAIAADTDGDFHRSTSVAVSGNILYASMGSSCNSCDQETDPLRASIVKLPLIGGTPTVVAKYTRNAIALAVDPATGHLWAAGAGQDDLPTYHPYEYADDVTASAASGVANYGWPYCEENHHTYSTPPSSWPNGCNGTVQPLVEFPAYITHIGAAFYPVNESGTYALPSPYRGNLLVTSHGSWHTPTNGCTLAPEVDAVAMNGDTPASAVNWSSPTTQFTNLVTGFQTGCTSRYGRATGIAVGSKGSIFVSDDQTGNIYRIRP